MTRPNSIAVGGYFPTPPDLIPQIAALIDTRTLRGRYGVLDPCAGDGAALLALGAALFGDQAGRNRFFAIELERERARTVQTRLRDLPGRALHADAFLVEWTTTPTADGMDVLWLNPPYQALAGGRRLEHEFLERFTPIVVAGGLLLFLVPFRSLAASALLLARHYHTITCYRVPEPHWSPFNQVVLIGVKRPVPDSFVTVDSSLVQTIAGWAADAASIPVLPDAVATPPYALRVPGYGGVASFQAADLDVAGTLADAPTGAGIRALALDLSPDDLGTWHVAVAQPPKPGHIASVLAAGGFAGVRVESHRPGLPPLLVSACFERTFRTTGTRQDADGAVVGYVQTQAPRLRVSVLDLHTFTYHDLPPGILPTGTTDVAALTGADLLDCYHADLVAALAQRCPAIHDPQRPDHQRPVPATARPLFTVQHHAVQTALKLLERGVNPFLLGEVGTGKSTVALHTAFAAGAQRVLVVCPSHLLHSWVEQVAAVLPGATPVVVEQIRDLEALPQVRVGAGAGMLVSILSQERAKLGAALVAGVPHCRCPACGAPTPPAHAVVRHRRWCQARQRRPGDALARLCIDLAHLLLPVNPAHHVAQALAPGRMIRQVPRQRWAAWAADRLDLRRRRFSDWVLAHPAETAAHPLLGEAVVLLALSVPDPARQTLLLTEMARCWAGHAHLQRFVRVLVLLLWNTEHAEAVGQELCQGARGGDARAWTDFFRDLRGETQHHQVVRAADGNAQYRVAGQTFTVGSSEAALEALTLLADAATWHTTAPCGTPLYQMTPRPRRYPLASYIRRYRPDCYDFLILDEVQHFKHEGTAQERAAHRLAEGKPGLWLTGSVSSGTASSLFMNLWALNRPFRTMFRRDQRSEFVTRYGYRKQYVPVGTPQGDATYGAVTDRVERGDRGTIRQLGEAPGVLPDFIVRSLLPCCIWMHKRDLDDGLPGYDEVRVEVEPEAEQMQRYTALQDAVLAQIATDRWERGSANVLLGQLPQLPAYLDRCTVDTGNAEGDAWEVRYPQEMGGGLVTTAPLFPAATVLPKERWLTETITAELAQDRPVLVFIWHTRTGLPARLQRLLADAGIASRYLDAATVGTRTRQQWIERQIADGCRVLLVNPVAVQTGLNSLVHFCTVIWYQVVVPDAVVWRQANGRSHRIGQTRPVRVLVPVYRGTPQTTVLDINALKVQSSMVLDGLDVSAALSAAGAGAGIQEAYDLGRLIYERLLAHMTESHT